MDWKYLSCEYFQIIILQEQYAIMRQITGWESVFQWELALPWEEESMSMS